MSNRKYPSAEHLRQCFRYEDGKLFWLVRPREHFNSDRAWKITNTRFSGKEAGAQSISPCRGRPGDPRWLVRVDDQLHSRYRIVWTMHYGEWPNMIDHENRKSLDDRIGNLRLCNKSQNFGNSKKGRRNKSGYKGVCWHSKCGKWRANISINGRQTHLGLFDDPREAHAAYVAAAEKHFMEFACSG